jgi:hypothetical protein
MSNTKEIPTIPVNWRRIVSKSVVQAKRLSDQLQSLRALHIFLGVDSEKKQSLEGKWLGAG